MSDLMNLLDDMLTDAGDTLREQEQREQEEKRLLMEAARAEQEKVAKAEAEAQAARDAAEAAIPKIEGVEELLKLSSADLQQVLAKLPPNDLLIVLAKGSDALQRRLLANLSKDSVQWLRQNLEYLGDPADLTDALAEGSQKAAVTLTNKMLRAGAIDLPKEPEEGAEGAGAASQGSADEGNPLLSVLVELVAVAHKAGPEALSEVIDDPGDPLLAVGLSAIAAGDRGGALEAKVDAARQQLLADFEARLSLIASAIGAMAEREEPASFAARAKRA